MTHIANYVFYYCRGTYSGKFDTKYDPVGA